MEHNRAVQRFVQPRLVSISCIKDWITDMFRIRAYIGRVKVAEADADIIPDAGWIEEMRSNSNWEVLESPEPTDPQPIAA